jgi:pyrimidine operon attenuation protein/uracil phosphoribosyltransferase
VNVELVGNARTRKYYAFDESLYDYVQDWFGEGYLAAFDDPKQAEENQYSPYRRGPQRDLMSASDIESAIVKIKDSIVNDIPDLADVVLVGIISGGALLAQRLRHLIEMERGVRLQCGKVGVLRDDESLQDVDGLEPVTITDRIVILVDDVFSTGRTVQKAMTTLWRWGRPRAVKLAVLVNRGHRILPFEPTYYGKNIPTARSERVQVRLGFVDAEGHQKSHDRVTIYSMVDSMKEREAAR